MRRVVQRGVECNLRRCCGHMQEGRVISTGEPLAILTGYKSRWWTSQSVATPEHISLDFSSRWCNEQSVGATGETRPLACQALYASQHKQHSTSMSFHRMLKSPNRHAGGSQQIPHHAARLLYSLKGLGFGLTLPPSAHPSMSRWGWSGSASLRPRFSLTYHLYQIGNIVRSVN